MSTMIQAEGLLIRQEWISACRFHDLTEAEVLREVGRRVSDLRSKAGSNRKAHPLVLLDLDSTLYEVGPRTFRIIQEWIADPRSQEFPKVRQTLSTLLMNQVGYSMKDIFLTLGMNYEAPENQPALTDIKKFWSDRFFANSYLQYDHAYPGAVHFARNLHELGAEIVYLTGRDEPGMGDGTRANLIRDGFPWDIERTHLLMKAAFHLPDLDHKKNAAHYIRDHGTLVASFENEPPNLIALYEIFPDAMHVFVDTVCSDHAAMPREGLYRIQGFEIG